MSSDTVSVFICGDSWAQNGDSQTWPLQVVNEIGAIPHNFAKPSATSDALAMQIENFKASNRNRRVDAAIIHTGGNNCLEDLEKTMTEGAASIGDKLCQDIKAGVYSLNKMGVKRYVVAGVPFSANVPCIKEQIQEYWYAEHKCRDFAGAEASAKAQAEALNQKISDTLQALRQELPETKIIYFQEIRELQKWKVEEDLFDETQLHPNHKGHAKLQKVVLDLWNMEGFPKGSAKALPSSTQTGGAPLTPQKIEAPLKRALDDDTCADSLDQQFDKACREVKMSQEVQVGDQLELYGLYKQATEGDNANPKPGAFSALAAKEKWKAWDKFRGIPQDLAKSKYVDKVKLMLSGGADGKKGRFS